MMSPVSRAAPFARDRTLILQWPHETVRRRRILLTICFSMSLIVSDVVFALLRVRLRFALLSELLGLLHEVLDLLL